MALTTEHLYPAMWHLICSASEYVRPCCRQVQRRSKAQRRLNQLQCSRQCPCSPLLAPPASAPLLLSRREKALCRSARLPSAKVSSAPEQHLQTWSWHHPNGLIEELTEMTARNCPSLAFQKGTAESKPFGSKVVVRSICWASLFTSTHC